MCNRYNVKTSAKEVADFLQATLPMDFDLPAADTFPGRLAPGLPRNLEGADAIRSRQDRRTKTA